MNTLELLGELRALDIAIRLDGERLQIDAPRNALTPELQERIARNKAEILTFLRESVASVAPQGPLLERVSRDGDLLLSHAQQRLWFLDQLEPGSAAYLMPSVALLHGELDVAVLGAALTELARRHEALRTVFDSRDGSPYQTVLPPAPVDVAFRNLESLPQAERHAAALAIVEREVRTPFDLAVGPLFRCTVVRLAADAHVLVLVFHHIVFDAWSGGVFHHELGELYQAFRVGKPSPLPEPQLHYIDFAQWQRKSLDEGGRDRHLAYWKQQLGGDVVPLELPADRPRSPASEERGGSCTAPLPHKLVQDLRRVGQGEGATLSMTLLAAFELLLHRLSGQDDFLIGAPVAGRGRPETESMIGFFVNTVVLRSSYSQQMSFAELLRQTRATMLDAHAHQEMPFEELVSALDPERDLSRPPLFQIFFNHLQLGAQSIGLPGIPAEPFVELTPKSKFELTLYIEERATGVSLRFVYDSLRFDHSRMQGMLEQYRRLLEQAVQSPERAVGEHSLVTPEAARVLPDPVAPVESSLADGTLVCDGLGELGKAPALVGADRVWTYAELDTYADRVARFLMQSGVRRGDVVAVVARRDPALVCALLGVLRAGGAFAIFDPAYPEARLMDCWRLAAPKACIYVGLEPAAAAALRAAMAEGHLAVEIELSDEWFAENSVSGSADLPDVNADDLAYVAFTSGTTGGVKAILGTHGPVAHFLEWERARFGFTRNDRFAMLSGLSHDPLLRDAFAPLWSGAKLLVPPAQVFSEAPDLAEWLVDEQVSVVHVTPALAQAVAIASGSSRSEHLRYAFVGGDRLSLAVVAQLRQFAPNVSVVNFYGATETPQAMAFHVVEDGESQRPSGIPLGHGIDGVQVLVLSPAGLAGVGELGEIVVRTRYLSAGYRGDDMATRQRFCTNPLTSANTDRIYRSGDLGRYLPSGLVEFVGRKDGQIKVRGFRVELGEIEAALRGQPGVAKAIALVRADSGAEPRVVAYVVPDGAALDAGALKLALAARLPAYAMPTAIVALDDIPLTPNGKIDVRALPLTADARAGDGELGRPLTPLENQLLAIWKQVLGKEDLQATDGFFDVGGNSLVAVRLFSQLRNVFGKDLPISTLFRASTVQQLAALMVDEGRSMPWKSLVAIQPTGAKPPLFMVPGIGGNVLEFARLAHLLGANQPFYGTQSQGLDGQGSPLRRIEDMATAYLSELRSVQPHGPYYLGGACMGGIVAFEMAQRLRAAGERVVFLALVDTPAARSSNSRRRAVIYVVYPIMYLFQGVARHFQAARGKGLRAWIDSLRMLFRIAWQMVTQRDIYRGDRSVLYQDMVTAANYEAMVNYKPREYEGDVRLFIAAGRAVDPKNETRLAWRDFVRGDLAVFKINAKDSGELLKPPHIGRLADIFRELLGKSAPSDAG